MQQWNSSEASALLLPSVRMSPASYLFPSHGTKGMWDVLVALGMKSTVLDHSQKPFLHVCFLCLSQGPWLGKLEARVSAFCCSVDCTVGQFHEHACCQNKKQRQHNKKYGFVETRISSALDSVSFWVLQMNATCVKSSSGLNIHRHDWPQVEPTFS